LHGKTITSGWQGTSSTVKGRRRLTIRTGGGAVIVCSCNVISDEQVRAVAAERPVRGTSEVYRCLGCSAECGRCARTIRRIMDEVGARPAENITPCGCG